MIDLSVPQAEGRLIGGVRFLDNDATPSVLWHAFKLAGIEFIDGNGSGPGVRLRKSPPAKPSKR